MLKLKKSAKQKRFVGTAMLGVAFILPLTNLPQINTLYSTKVTAGLSLQTWAMYLLFGVIPLAYALINKLTPLIISNILWTIVNIIMIGGIIRFGFVEQSAEFETLLVINNIGKMLSGLGFILLSTALILLSRDIMYNHGYAKAK